MIRYIHIPGEKKTVAILDGCQDDAINKIRKNLRNSNLCVADENKYKMKFRYRSVVVCTPNDVYDAKKGEEIAKQKLLKKYYRDFDSIMYKAEVDLRETMQKFFPKNT